MYPAPPVTSQLMASRIVGPGPRLRWSPCPTRLARRDRRRTASRLLLLGAPAYADRPDDARPPARPPSRWRGAWSCSTRDTSSATTDFPRQDQPPGAGGRLRASPATRRARRPTAATRRRPSPGRSRGWCSARLERLGATCVLTRRQQRRAVGSLRRRARPRRQPGRGPTSKLSIHGDGSIAAGARGFHVIAPADRRPWTHDIYRLVVPARRRDPRRAASPGTPVANYIAGGDGLDVRSDLGTLNLSDIPTVMVELGNMRNPTDARRMTSRRRAGDVRRRPGRRAYAATCAEPVAMPRSTIATTLVGARLDVGLGVGAALETLGECVDQRGAVDRLGDGARREVRRSSRRARSRGGRSASTWGPWTSVTASAKSPSRSGALAQSKVTRSAAQPAVGGSGAAG